MKIPALKQIAAKWLGTVVGALREDLGSKTEFYLAVVLIPASLVALPLAKKLQLDTVQLALLGTMLLFVGVRLWLPLALDLMTAAVSIDSRVPLKPWAILSLCAVLLWSGCLGFAHIVSPALVEAYTKLDADQFGRAVAMISVWLAIALALYAAGFVCACVALGALCSFMFKSKPLSKMMAAVATVTVALTLMLLGTMMLEQETSTAFVGQELAQYNFSRGQSRCSNVGKTTMVHALPDSNEVVVWEKGDFTEKVCDSGGEGRARKVD